MKYIQCPHCNAFMSISGLTYVQEARTCQNDKCAKNFKARLVKILTEYVEVIKEENK